MYGAGACRLLLLLVFVSEARAVETGYDLLVLLPLTGPREGYGRALLAGVQAALPPTANRTQAGASFTLAGDGGGNLDVCVFYTDTQCEPVSEDTIISRHLESGTGRRLVAVGGLCHQGMTLGSSTSSLQDSLYIRQNLPQVTFEDSFLPYSLLAASPVSVRPGVRSAYRPLVSWLRTRSCLHVTLLTTSSNPSAHKETESLRDELSENKITISLQIDFTNADMEPSLRQSRARVVILQGDAQKGKEQLCQLVNVTKTTAGRYVWVLLVTDAVTSPVTSLQPCTGLLGYTIVIFRVQAFTVEPQKYDAFVQTLQSREPEVAVSLLLEAALASDTMTLTLETLMTLHKVVPRMSRQQFTDRFIRELTRGSQGHIMGDVWFDEGGVRDVPVQRYILDEYGLATSNESFSGTPLVNYSQVRRQVALHGVSLSVFVVMTSLALIGTIYALLILIFNMLKRNDKMIRMTSPNINMVIVMGAIMGYVAMVTLGLDSSRVSLQTMGKLVQASTFLLAIGYSLVFGSLFAKAWRVFFIFKNLNANGKNTRDEHLLFGVFLLVGADLFILIPWAAADPITCSYVNTSTTYQPVPPTDIIAQTDACVSSLHVMWVLVLYVLKGGILVTGLYFTFQTRHVTLPTLRDAREVYEVVYTVVVVSALCLPVLLSSALSISVKYAVGALAIFTVVTATLTLCFVPKICLLWRRADKTSPDSVRFLFSQSLRRTQRHLASCSLCCPLVSSRADKEDKYAQEVLGSEIDTLKLTIKEKEATIRELTDRLYFGTDKKLHEYIFSPRRLTTSPEGDAYTQQQHMRPPSQLMSQPHDCGAAHPDGRLPVMELPEHISPESNNEAMYHAYCRRSRRSERHRRRSQYTLPPSEMGQYQDPHVAPPSAMRQYQDNGQDLHVAPPSRTGQYQDMHVAPAGKMEQYQDPHVVSSSEIGQYQEQVDTTVHNEEGGHNHVILLQAPVNMVQYYSVPQGSEVPMGNQSRPHTHLSINTDFHTYSSHNQNSPISHTHSPNTHNSSIDNDISPGYTRHISPNHIMMLPDSHKPKYGTPSPNHDSAIDNNSPSSAGSDQDMSHQQQYTSDNNGNTDTSWGHPGGLDIDAIEEEVIHVSSFHFPRTPTSVNSYYENGMAVSQI